jgi:hypothetical protein
MRILADSRIFRAMWSRWPAMRCTLLAVRGSHTVLRPFLGRPVVRRGRPSRLRPLLRLRRLLLLSCLLQQGPAGRVVPATAEGRAAGGGRARGVAAAGLAKGTRVRHTATLGEVLAYFSGVGVSVADLEPYDLGT